MKGKSQSKKTIEKIRKNRLETIYKKYGVSNVSQIDYVRKKISETKIKNYNSGKTKPLRGSFHPNWKGGYSNIYQIIYSDNKFYKEWKYPILVRDGFKCIKCKSSENLHIHHDKEKLNEIYKRIIKENEFCLEFISFETKIKLKNKIVDYHIKNNVSGITLCKKCHKKLHPQYNL